MLLLEHFNFTFIIYYNFYYHYIFFLLFLLASILVCIMIEYIICAYDDDDDDDVDDDVDDDYISTILMVLICLINNDDDSSYSTRPPLYIQKHSIQPNSLLQQIWPLLSQCNNSFFSSPKSPRKTGDRLCSSHLVNLTCHWVSKHPPPTPSKLGIYRLLV